jgi:hypothetical protein
MNLRLWALLTYLMVSYLFAKLQTYLFSIDVPRTKAAHLN